jgi:hypothetical protein
LAPLLKRPIEPTANFEVVLSNFLSYLLEYVEGLYSLVPFRDVKYSVLYLCPGENPITARINC